MCTHPLGNIIEFLSRINGSPNDLDLTWREQISCHNHNLKWLNLDCIYRICYKNANTRKRICPIEKSISQLLNPLFGCWIH